MASSVHPKGKSIEMVLALVLACIALYGSASVPRSGPGMTSRGNPVCFGGRGFITRNQKLEANTNSQVAQELEPLAEASKVCLLRCSYDKCR